jgi:hypothetical protein
MLTGKPGGIVTVTKSIIFKIIPFIPTISNNLTAKIP